MKRGILILCIALISVSCVKNEWDTPHEPAKILAPNQAFTTLDENFDEVSKVDGQIPILPKGWVNSTLVGTRAFQTAIMSNNTDSSYARCLQGTGYLALSEKVDSWIVLPPLNITNANNTNLSFKAAYAYEYGGRTSTLEVRYIALNLNEEAPEISKQWKLASTPSSSKPKDWFVFKDYSIDLAPLAGTKNVIYVAFRYIAELPSLSSGWYIDDIRYNVQDAY
ncbi:MAG: choice-of-anchor J domain-containing protein, partial [Bacteroidales bacterium]